jgi:hypothetical protein
VGYLLSLGATITFYSYRERTSDKERNILKNGNELKKAVC